MRLEILSFLFELAAMLGCLWFMVNRNHSCDWTHTATTSRKVKKREGKLNVGLNGCKRKQHWLPSTINKDTK
jgi:hypothetical protein